MATIAMTERVTETRMPAPAESARTAKLVEEATTTAANRRAPVVLVEANDGTRTLISSVLAQAGFEVLPTSDGIEALAAIKLLHTQPPSVIVVDAALPVMDAAAFLRAYRQQPGPHAPAIILTDQPPTNYDAPTGPVAAVLAKPVAFEELLAVVGRYATPTARARIAGPAQPSAASSE
jgi:CheY-like chemotaxis protein